jgi:predicted membrane-bound spermidine synthase
MRRTAPVLLIFVLSGAAGLVYEVVWARQLVLVFGNTTQAVSAILTGFFGGMAIGGVFGGRLGDRVRRPLRLYGILELVLVVLVLATPATFHLLHEVYRGAFGALETSPVALSLVRFALSILALGPATILMGATLPTLTRYLTRDPTQLSRAFGRLYAANTIGAILGTIAAGFVLIELLGLTGTLVVGAACSATAGAIALALDRRRTATMPRQDSEVRDSPVPLGAARPRMKLAVGVAFASGLTSLGYQTLWTRLLASGTGNSTYVFTAILAVFLVGLAAGALTFAILRSRIRDTVSLLAHGQAIVALFALIGISVIDRQFQGQLYLTANFDLLFTGFLWPVIIVVLPATFVMGLTFPAASALVADPEGRVSTNSGLLLSANTLGAICGTFLVPFVFIPTLGAPTTLGIVALTNAVVGVALALRGGLVSRLARVVASAIGVSVWLGVGISLVAGGVFVDPNVARLRHANVEVFASREDEIASVQAGEVDGYKQLWVTGTSMTLLTVDAKLMPILPLMLRPASTTELTIAFGMGSAYRSALNAGLTADVVELVPSVPDMFASFYSDAPQVLANPNGRVIIADGRNHVELTDKTYDIIVVDPPPPIESAGVSVISSREFYAAAAARLNAGGVMMQWIPYGQLLDEFKAHVRAYRDVFAHVIIAFGPGGYGFFMLGSAEPIALDPAAIREVLSRPGIVTDLSSAFDAPEHTVDGWAARIPQQVWIQGDQVAAFAGPGPMVTDDRPLPEYFLLRHLFGVTSPQVTPGLLLQIRAALPSGP